MSVQNLWRRLLPIAVVLFASIVGKSAVAQESELQVEITDVEFVENPVEVLFEPINTVLFAQEKFWTGVHLSPVDAALRTQLDLAENQGVVVAGVESGSPAEEAGIQPHDVLLTIGGSGVSDTDTFMERLVGLGEEAATVVLLRGGKRLSLEMTPQSRDWDVLTYHITDQYRIGVGVADADASLRSQLGLPDGQGLVVTDVLEDSPGAQAGIELHDILLEFGGKPLGTTEDLVSQVQEVGDRPATMELIRSGERQSIRVTPESQTDHPLNFRLIEADVLYRDELILEVATGQAIEELMVVVDPEEETTEQQLERLIQEMVTLTERMEALQRSIQTEPGGGTADVDDASDGAGDGE